MSQEEVNSVKAMICLACISTSGVASTVTIPLC